MNLKKLSGRSIPVLIVAVIAYFLGVDSQVLSDLLEGRESDVRSERTESVDQPGAIRAAFEARRSDDIVRARGRVLRVLRDDNEGSRHQRFIVEVEDGLSVLIAHNIDLAPRVAGLKVGDTVEFRGEYEWNDRGGVVHWTHHDPRGSHPEGWIRHNGQTYE